MKYRLKKDLPFAKAGTEIKFQESGLDGQNITYEVDPKNGLRIWIADVCPLIKQGWIEEVKPREVYVEFFKDTDKISDSSFDLTNLRNDARFYTKRFIEVTG